MEIILNLKALSYNNYLRNTKSGRKFISLRGKKYLTELNKQLNKYDKELREFGASLEENKSLVGMEINYYLNKFYTKKNTISKTVGDVDNPNKILIDQIFNRIGWDDYVLGKLSCEKSHSISNDKVVIKLIKYDVIKHPSNDC